MFKVDLDDGDFACVHVVVASGGFYYA